MILREQTLVTTMQEDKGEHENKPDARDGLQSRLIRDVLRGKMKDKQDTSWYKWKFSFAGILWIIISGSVLYSIVKNPSESIWMNLIILAPVVFFIYYIAKSEWKFKRPRHIKITKNKKI